MDITTSQADGLPQTEQGDRNLAAYVAGDTFDAAAALGMFQSSPQTVQATLAAYERSLIAIRDLPDAEKLEAQKTIAHELRPIGAKIAPHLSAEQSKTWRFALAQALGDLSRRTALRAAREALHVPASFLADVERIIRDKAAVIDGKHSRAMLRLRRLIEEIRRASTLRITDESGRAPTTDEIASWPPFVVRMGLKAGHITEADLIGTPHAENEEVKNVAA